MRNRFFKAFLCLVALLCTATSMKAAGVLPDLSSREAPKYYKMYNPAKKMYLMYASDSKTFATTKYKSLATAFYFVGDGSTVDVADHDIVGATNFTLYASNSDDYFMKSATSAWINSGDPGRQWYMSERTNGDYTGFVFSYVKSDGSSIPQIIALNSSNAICYNGNDYNDAAGIWTVEYTEQTETSLDPAEILPELSTDGTTHYYRIYNQYANKYLVYDDNSAGSNTVTVTANAEEASLFYFKEGQFQTLPSSFTAGGTELNNAIAVDVFAQESGTKLLRTATGNWVEPSGNDGRQWYLAPTTFEGYTGLVMAYYKSDKTPNGDGVSLNTSATSLQYGAGVSHQGIGNYKGSLWTVEFVKTTEISADAAITSITWSIMDGDDVVYSETKNGAVEGEEYTFKTTTPGVNLIGETTVIAGKEDQFIDLTYTIAENAPFQYSTDFASAKWYSMTIRGTKAPCYDEESDVITNGTVPAEAHMGHLFAFVGNPWNLKILNAVAGEGYAVGADVENGARLYKMELAEATEYRFEKNGSTLAFAPLANTTAHLNDFNGELAYWTASASGTDAGSNFRFEPVDEAHVQALFNGTVVWKYTSPVADVTTFDLAQASNYDMEAGKFTANGGWTFDTPKDLTNHMWLVVTTTFNAAEASRAFTITDANGKSYSGDTKNKDGEALSVGPRGKMWLDRWNNQICAAINLNTLLKDGFALDQVSSLTFGSGSPVSAVYLTNYEDGQAVKNTEGWGSCKGDYVREYAHLNDGEYAFGTVCLPYAAAVSGAKVYRLTDLDGATLVLTQVNGVLEAGVPYIFKADDTVGKDNSSTGASNVNFFRVDANEVAAPVATSTLVGTFAEIDAPVGSYVLQNQDDKFGFYLVGETVPTISANRAYITTYDEEVKAYYFNADATAINAVEAITSGKAQIYDMSGRKLQNLQKGINIVNGVKVLVK